MARLHLAKANAKEEILSRNCRFSVRREALSNNFYCSPMNVFELCVSGYDSFAFVAIQYEQEWIPVGCVLPTR